MKRVLAKAVAFVVGALATYYILRGAVALVSWYDRFPTIGAVFVVELLRLGLPALGGLLLAVWVARARRFIPTRQAFVARRSLARRAVVVLFAILYAITWAFGAPAVSTSLVNRTVASYKADVLRDLYPARLAPGLPLIDVRFAAPLLPGVLVVWYDGLWGGQAGGGGWVFFAWWGLGHRQIGQITRWAS